MADRAGSEAEANVPSVRVHPRGKVRDGDYMMVTVPNGFVQRNAYFTAREIRNAAYEQRFRSNHPVRCDRGETFGRRDVRWYEPRRPGAERCGAVIHVAVCRGGTLDVLATERTRAELVALEPEMPIGAHCGARADEGEGATIPLSAPVVPVPALPCEVTDIAPVRPLHVWPSTRLGVRTFVDPRLVTGEKRGSFDSVRRIPETVLGPAAYHGEELQPQFMRSGIVQDQGTNIILEQRVAVSPSGQGYCISLLARQGGRIWRRGFVRNSGESPMVAPVGWRDASAVLRDAHALARALRADLVTTPFELDR